MMFARKFSSENIEIVEKIELPNYKPREFYFLIKLPFSIKLHWQLKIAIETKH